MDPRDRRVMSAASDQTAGIFKEPFASPPILCFREPIDTDLAMKMPLASATKGGKGNLKT